MPNAAQADAARPAQTPVRAAGLRHIVWLLASLLLLSLHGVMASAHAAGTTAPRSAEQLPDPASLDALKPDQRIVVHRNAGTDPDVLVSVGIPFAPGVLHDPQMLRILDAQGREVPAAVQTTLRWYAGDPSVRAVRAQFRITLTDRQATFYFRWDQPRRLSTPGWPYAQGMVTGEHGLQEPTVIATLAASWLCASQVAGPQQPATAGEAYAAYVSRQFQWAQKLPTEDFTAWLFDRPSTLYKAYVRSGRLDYLQAAITSYHFYMKYIRRSGLTMDPFCAGGWTFSKKPCDVKYVYIEPTLLALALTGDDSQYDPDVIDKMVSLWQSGGWSGAPGPYTSPSQYFTERLAGLGLLEVVSAYELTGNPRYLHDVNQRVGWLFAQQRHNPDGLGDDGSWRNSWQKHEGDTYDPATDVRGSSPWMSENIVDGLWHAWLVTRDPRIPDMITDFGRYLERYGWISPALLVNPHDWRDPCSGPQGQIAWYWSSAHASTAVLEKIQDSDGWYSDAHNVELTLPVAAAYYFERDPEQRAALKRRLGQLASSYSLSCAANSKTPRRFNWNNRGTGVVQWLIRQPGGSGAPAGATSTPGAPAR